MNKGSYKSQLKYAKTEVGTITARLYRLRTYYRKKGRDPTTVPSYQRTLNELREAKLRRALAKISTPDTFTKDKSTHDEEEKKSTRIRVIVKKRRTDTCTKAEN